MFIGYFIAFLMSLHKYGFVCQIIGYYVMFIALRKLMEYKHILSRAVLPLLGMVLCSLFDAAEFVTEGVSFVEFPTALSITVGVLRFISCFIFHIYLLGGISSLANDTELPKLSSLARWNLVFVTFYIFVSLLLSIISLFPRPEESILLRVTGFLAPTAALISILYPIFMLYLLYGCFAQICAPEDVELKSKPSRFSFINKSREMTEQKNKEMEEWIAEYKAKKIEKKKRRKK